MTQLRFRDTFEARDVAITNHAVEQFQRRAERNNENPGASFEQAKETVRSMLARAYEDTSIGERTRRNRSRRNGGHEVTYWRLGPWRLILAEDPRGRPVLVTAERVARLEN